MGPHGTCIRTTAAKHCKPLQSFAVCIITRVVTVITHSTRSKQNVGVAARVYVLSLGFTPHLPAGPGGPINPGAPGAPGEPG